MSAERDLAEAIRDEIISRHALDAALTIWHDRPHWDERQRMWAVLAGISCCAIDAVLARRQSEAARTGPWDGPQEEDGYPGSLLPRKRGTP